MADLGVVQRRGLMWIWGILAVLLAAGVVWLATTIFEGRAADLEIDMDAGETATRTASPP